MKVALCSGKIDGKYHNCPCFNTAPYDDVTDCNLGYEFKSGPAGTDVGYYSENCGLVKIVCKEETLTVERVEI
jgi:hypothetical protein